MIVICNLFEIQFISCSNHNGAFSKLSRGGYINLDIIIFLKLQTSSSMREVERELHVLQNYVLESKKR